MRDHVQECGGHPCTVKDDPTSRRRQWIRTRRRKRRRRRRRRREAEKRARTGQEQHTESSTTTNYEYERPPINYVLNCSCIICAIITVWIGILERWPIESWDREWEKAYALRFDYIHRSQRNCSFR